MQVETVVIGAGLTGLTTAYYLNKKNASFKVLETKNRVGGVIETQEKNGFVYEKGPNTGILGTPEIAELFEDLQSDCELELGNENVSKRYILYNGKWQALPSGLKQGVKTPLFTLRDKFRLLGEPFRKKGNNELETLAELVKRRMGQSFLDYAIDPFILGVYAGDPAYLVPKFALPKLYTLEQNFGSFIGGAIKKKFKVKPTEREKKATRKIFTIKGGLASLTESLYEKAGKENFDLGANNISIDKTDNGYSVEYQDSSGSNVVIKTMNIITTVPAFELKSMLPFVDNSLINDVQNVYYAPVAEVAIGFNQWTGIPLDGFGGLIPHKEGRDILGVMYMSSLFANRAPNGGALISVFIGGARRPELAEASEDAIKEIVSKEFKALMGIKTFEPDLFEISYHNSAIPQYGKESQERFAAIEKVQNQYKGLIIGGNLHNGIGMADRVKQGKELSGLII